MDWQVWFVGILFIVVYGIIISEKIHRTIIALYSYLYSINKGNWSNQSYVNCRFMVGVIAGSLPGWKRNHCRCLGNVIVSGISAREGYPITFLGYMKIAFPLMLVSIVISTIYLLVFFL